MTTEEKLKHIENLAQWLKKIDVSLSSIFTSNEFPYFNLNASDWLCWGASDYEAVTPELLQLWKDSYQEILEVGEKEVLVAYYGPEGLKTEAECISDLLAVCKLHKRAPQFAIMQLYFKNTDREKAQNPVEKLFWNCGPSSDELLMEIKNQKENK